MASTGMGSVALGITFGVAGLILTAGAVIFSLGETNGLKVPTIFVDVEGLELAGGEPWDYDPHGPLGPHNWGLNRDSHPDEDTGANELIYPSCAGQRQSPIDFSELDTVSEDTYVPIDRFFTYEGDWNLKARPGGHPGFLVEPDDAVAMLENNEWVVDGEVFKFVQAHFHAGSEHTLEGQQFPLEAHFVHARCNCVDVELPCIRDNQDCEADIDGNLPLNASNLAVFGILYPNAEGIPQMPNEFLHEFWDNIYGYFNAITNTEDEVVHLDVGQFPLNEMWNDLAEKNDDEPLYIRYDGSLTTPGCREIVRWHVAVANNGVNVPQVLSYEGLFDFPNYRATQPLNGRVPVAYGNVQRSP